ncbi:SCO6880 family protein [Gordonia sp. (in: high G+C Gram-positive bacteria)]|uniref:SCO6880 family protein n=1 Tax=Gordonia sp. (in: high G+C Gram-positive bacteria) TaxID=84139 RepID=UPI003C742C40
MTANTHSNNVILYGRWERPRSSGLFGRTWGETLFAGGVIVSVILLRLFTNSWPLALTVLTIGVAIFIPLIIRRNGRSGLELIAMRFQFWKGARKGENIYAGGVFGVIPGAARMPGIQGDTRLYEYELRNGDRFGLIHAKARDHYSVFLDAQPQGQERVEQWQINAWVHNWDLFLANLGTVQGLVGCVVVIESVPDNGYRVREEVKRLVDPAAPEYAKRVMMETATERVSARVRNEVRIQLTFSRQRSADSAEVADQGAAIGRVLSSIVDRAVAAGLSARTISAADLCVAAARAYRPELTRELEAMAGAGEHGDLRWDMVGPRGCKGEWDSFVHNGYRSVTWEMSAAPAGTVAHDTLLPLLAPRADLEHKRVAVVYRPHGIADAVRMVDADFKDALAAEQAKTGVGSAAASLRVDNTRAARQEQARGAGLTRFGLMVSLTAPRDADMPTLAAEVEGLGSASRLTLQRMWGGQDSAFAGALGLGIVLPEYASINRRVSA